MAETAEDDSLAGRTVLVLGATGGVGEGVTRALLTRGALVVAASRTEARLDQLQGRMPLSSRSRLRSAVIDVSTDDTSEVTRRLTGQFGPLDGAVVTIADAAGGRQPIMSTTDEMWDAAVLANLTSQFRAFKALVPALSSDGALVNISGFSAEIPFPGSAMVAAFNAASKSLAVTLAAELASTGPRVYELILGFIQTRQRREAGQNDLGWYAAEDVGDHAARLIAGSSAHLSASLHYLVDPASGVQTSRATH